MPASAGCYIACVRLFVTIYAALVATVVLLLALLALDVLPTWLEDVVPYLLVMVLEVPIAALGAMLWRRIVVEGATGALRFPEEDAATPRQPTLESLARDVAALSSMLDEISEKLEPEETDDPKPEPKPEPEEEPDTSEEEGKAKTPKRRATQKGKRQ